MAKTGIVLTICLITGCSQYRAWAEPGKTQSCRELFAGWTQPGDHMIHAAPPVEISIDDAGTIRWNGSRVTRPILSEHLRETASAIETNPVFPMLNFTSKAPCAEVRKIRAEMERAFTCKTGFCGQGSEWDFFRTKRNGKGEVIR